MPLRLYNSLTKKEEEFVPLHPPAVTMYTCGPTVYSRPHIGNYASFLMADLLRRWLEAGHGYTVMHVKNITDVGHLLHDSDRGDDKIEKEAAKAKVHPLEIAKRYTDEYLADEKLLNILEATHRPRATETIPEMLAMIKVLQEKGIAYELPDGIYFAVETFPSYGRLSGNTIENLTAGARVEVHGGKRHPADFALWKKCVGENSHHVLRWRFADGSRIDRAGEDAEAGFPGWHIECSAMSRMFLGDTLDLHTGGEDNIFPHHECEIAQSESVTGKPFVRCFLHKRRIEVDNGDSPLGRGGQSPLSASQKMSKSLGNVLSLSDITAKGFSPMDLRYYLLSVHYRTQLKFSWKGMEDAKKARRKVVEWIEEICAHKNGDSPLGRGGQSPFSQEFTDAMDSDLNTPAALAAVFECMTASRSGVETPYHDVSTEFIDLIRRTFGCFEPEEGIVPVDVQALVDERAVARAKKDFAVSDRLRDDIRKKGFEVRDTGNTQDVRKL